MKGFLTLRQDPKLPRRLVFLLLALLAVVWFGNLDARKLIKADEGRYAEIAREMVASGDWTTPRLNGFKYFEKPPLQYWMTAAAYEAFGIREWTARLWPALTGFLGVIFAFYLGRRLFGPAGALLGAAVLASSLLYVLISHVITLDIGVSFFLFLAVGALVLAQSDSSSARERSAWMHAAWAAAALAVLSKGLIGFVLPAGALAAYVLIERDFRLLRRMHWLSGGALFLAISVPWFVAVSRANPEFLNFFFVHEHFERFLTRVHGRYQPPWYFIAILSIGFLPWIVALFPALWNAWKSSDAQERFRPARFLLVWSAVVLVFFSLSSSKLPSYILPMFPSLALLVGATLARSSRALPLWQGLFGAALGIAAMALAPGALQFAEPQLPVDLLEDYVPWLEAAGASLAAGSVACAVLAARRSACAAALALAAGSLVAGQLVLLGHEALSPAYSAYHIVERVRAQIRPDAPFYVVNAFDHTLPFYLGRTVTMVIYKDELAQAVTWEPHKFIPELAGFVRAWNGEREAFAMFSTNDFQEYEKTLSIPMQVIARDPRRVIVRKP